MKRNRLIWLVTILLCCLISTQNCFSQSKIEKEKLNLEELKKKQNLKPNLQSEIESRLSVNSLSRKPTREAEAAYDEGMRLLEAGDVYKAVGEFNKAAEGNHSDAMVELGKFYQKDRNFKDVNKAFINYQKAAELDNARGMAYLSICYRDGIGCKKDNKLAFAYAKKSADKKCDVGYYALGRCYYDGIGVGIDELQAIQNYEYAADANNVDACFNLGSIYEYGVNGGAPQKDKALVYYKKAANLGDAEAADKVQLIESELAKQNLAQKPEQSVQEPPTRGDDNPVPAMGVVTGLDDVAEQEPNEPQQEAVQDLSKMSEVQLYDTGNKLIQKGNRKEAAPYMREVYNINKLGKYKTPMQVEIKLGYCIDVVEKNEDVSFADVAKILQEIYDKGNSNEHKGVASYYLGRIYMINDPNNPDLQAKQPDYNEAYKWFCIAADKKNNIDAALYVADLYYEGNSNMPAVENTRKAAYDWYKKAESIAIKNRGSISLQTQNRLNELKAEFEPAK